MIDFNITPSKKITENDIYGAMVKYSNTELKNVLSYINEPLVYTYLIHSPYNVIVNLSITKGYRRHNEIHCCMA